MQNDCNYVHKTHGGYSVHETRIQAAVITTVNRSLKSHMIERKRYMLFVACPGHLMSLINHPVKTSLAKVSPAGHY